MNCQRCESKRIGFVNAKCGDLCYTEITDVGERDGGVPRDMGIGSGDYVRFSYCLDCGQMQGQFPLPPTALEEEGE